MITEYLTNPPVAITTGAVGITANLLIILPTLVNILMAAYLVFLIVHKGIQIYKEIKINKNESSQ